MEDDFYVFDENRKTAIGETSSKILQNQVVRRLESFVAVTIRSFVGLNF